MTQSSLIAREDTLLGVCQGLGEELGTGPLPFRIAFALALFANPMLVVIAYLAVGAALALFRWAFPFRRTAIAPAVVPVPRGDNDDMVGPIAEAA